MRSTHLAGQLPHACSRRSAGWPEGWMAWGLESLTVFAFSRSKRAAQQPWEVQRSRRSTTAICSWLAPLHPGFIYINFQLRTDVAFPDLRNRNVKLQALDAHHSATCSVVHGLNGCQQMKQLWLAWSGHEMLHASNICVHFTCHCHDHDRRHRTVWYEEGIVLQTVYISKEIALANQLYSWTDYFPLVTKEIIVKLFVTLWCHLALARVNPTARKQQN